MKANELMIGDWVVYNGDVEYTDPIKIEGMDIATDMLITSDREDVGFEGVEPIPLTAEILEKNGFIFDEIICKWEVEKTAFAIYKGRVDKAKFAIEYWKDEDDCMFVWIANSIVPLRHVHELQHALRLCGIEKDIQL